MIKIDIISGFLGAGKTTLIKKLLQEALTEEKVVLIENEFGEIGIDGGFLKETGVEMKEMNSGCICCSLTGDFVSAFSELIETYTPDRILIEPSGVGKLSDVISAIQNMKSKEELKLNNFVTVIDAVKCKMFMKNFGEFYNNQIAYAKTIVLSRTKNLKLTRLEECIHLLQDKNPKATIITTPWEEMQGKTILSAMEAGDALETHLLFQQTEEKHQADDVFESFGMETVRIYTKEELEACLTELSKVLQYGIVLRAKGMLPSVDGFLHFDYVPDEIQIRTGSADYTGRLCVIGSSLNREALKMLFQMHT